WVEADVVHRDRRVGLLESLDRRLHGGELGAGRVPVGERNRRLVLRRRPTGHARLGHRRTRAEPHDETDAREDDTQAKPPLRSSSHAPSFRTVTRAYLYN